MTEASRTGDLATTTPRTRTAEAQCLVVGMKAQQEISPQTTGATESRHCGVCLLGCHPFPLIGRRLRVMNLNGPFLAAGLVVLLAKERDWDRLGERVHL